MRTAAAAAVAASVVALDQLTKWAVVRAMPLWSEREVIPGLFSLVHSRNSGIAFGLLGSAGQVVRYALPVVIIVVVLLVMRQLARSGGDGLAGVGLAMLLGGALGNLTDRLVRGGEVVDFLDFYARWGGREHHWPSFNVADSCISIGAGLVILAEMLRSRRGAHAPNPD